MSKIQTFLHKSTLQSAKGDKKPPRCLQEYLFPASLAHLRQSRGKQGQVLGRRDGGASFSIVGDARSETREIRNTTTGSAAGEFLGELGISSTERRRWIENKQMRHETAGTRNPFPSYRTGRGFQAKSRSDRTGPDEKSPWIGFISIGLNWFEAFLCHHKSNIALVSWSTLCPFLLCDPKYDNE